jgi:hypothetical protein
METHDVRVIEAREALSRARRRDPSELTTSELRDEIAKFRRYVRWLIDLADDAADTDFNEHISQVLLWGGIYIAPADLFKLCDDCQGLIHRTWSTFDPSQERPSPLQFADAEAAMTYLTTFWGDCYTFLAPARDGSLVLRDDGQTVSGGMWTAAARFGAYNELREPTPEELLETVSEHFVEHRRSAIVGSL